MGPDRAELRDELAKLKLEAEALGYIYGMDFFIWSLPAFTSSEVVILDIDADEYVVVYSDMGHDRELGRSSDLASAREVFLEALARLAGPRNRGPYAGQPPHTGFEGMNQREVFEALQRDGRMPPDLTWEQLMNDPGGDDTRES